MRGQLILRWVLAAELVLWSIGCTVVESTHAFLEAHFVDRPDLTEREDESWVKQAGKEARGDRLRDRDPDVWFNKYFKSEKHREIERNLGVDQGF